MKIPQNGNLYKQVISLGIMEILESPETQTRQYVAQIERHERQPIVRSVLMGDTTFEEEVQDFYDLYALETEDSMKRGRYPVDLVEILGGFSEEPLDTSKLGYDSVRKDYMRWHAKSRKIIQDSLVMGGLLTGVGGLAACLVSATNGNPEVAILGGTVGVGGLGASFWKLGHYPKPKGTRDEWHEYFKLLLAAEEADEFVDEHYRNYFVRKALASS